MPKEQCSKGILFIYFVFEGNEYLYEYKFDCKNHLYIYEKMSKIIRDSYNNESEKIIFIKDNINDKYECPQDLKLQEVLNIASSDNILIYTVQVEKFENSYKKRIKPKKKNKL